MAIEYSDGGDWESRILELIKSGSDLSSTSPISSEQFHHWPIRYHLAPERANLLRHFDFSDMDVLELGAGMGAISRYLAENAKSLTVVEGTEARFAALCERLRDLTNWTGVVANIQDAQFEQKFDAVLLIGVLEYADLYVEAEDDPSPFHRTLRHAAQMLKPGGLLIVAIENRMGWKYFAGASEDHSSKLYDGICGYPPFPSGKTFSREQLLDLFGYVGMKVDEFYPFPDYKLPMTVLTSDLMESDPEVAGELAGSSGSEDYTGFWDKPFPEVLATRCMSHAGLLQELSNSFLFVGHKGGEEIRSRILSSRLSKNEIAWHYSWNRRMPIKTAFTKTGNQITVTKRPLGNSQAALNELVKWIAPPSTPVIRKKKLRTHLLELAYFGKGEQFLDEFAGFLKWSFDHWRLDDSAALQAIALDAVITNTFVPEGGQYQFYDLEWQLAGPMPKSWFVYRNVAQIGDEISRIPWREGSHTLAALYEELCQRLGITAALRDDLELDSQLTLAVTHRRGPNYGSVDFVLDHYQQVKYDYFRDPQALATMWQRLRYAESELEKVQQERNYLGAQVDQLSARCEEQRFSLERYKDTSAHLQDWITELEAENARASAELASRSYRYSQAIAKRLRKIPGLKRL